MDRKEYQKCTICKDTRLVKRLKVFGGILVRCTGCELVFRNPLPSSETTMEYYKKTYSNIFIEGKTKSYRGGIFGHLLKRLSKERQRGRLLDIGCGYGEFLWMAKADGWEAYGVEPSLDACQYIRDKVGINPFCGNLQEASFPKDYFDVVTLWNVLDHIEDPLKQLQEIKKVLKPGGLLFIRVPNFCFQEKAFLFGVAATKLFFNCIDIHGKITVSHLYCFDRSSIRRLINLSGFSILRIQNARLTRGDPYHTFPLLGDRCLTFIKDGFFIVCEALYYLSSGKALCAPSIEVFASRVGQVQTRRLT